MSLLLNLSFNIQVVDVLGHPCRLLTKQEMGVHCQIYWTSLTTLILNVVYKAAPKVIPLILCCWLTMSEVNDVGGITVRWNLHAIIPLHFVSVCQTAAEGQSNQMAANM